MPCPVLPRRWGATLVCLAFVAVATAGCSVGKSSGQTTTSTDETTSKAPSSGSSPSVRPTPTHDPAPRPKIGECRQLTFGAMGRYTNDGATTSCESSHTSLTFAVKDLPKDVAFDGVDIGNDAVQEKASLLCRADFARYVGGSAETRALSRLSVTYFLPTQQDFDAGSRWVRCDVIALQSPQVLAPLPNPVKDFNTTGTALDDYGVCSRGEPGSSGTLLVMCDQDHTYRALTALRLGSDSAGYPGEEVVGTDGQKRCDNFISDALGLGGGYTYAWTYPSMDDWRNGQRFGFCWNETTN